MAITRRALCSVGAVLVLSGGGGCLGGSDGTGGDDWEWSGTLPVDSVVQHHDPSCGCCGEYADYLESNGVDVRVEETDDLRTIKQDLGVPGDVASCHTVEFGDYIVEGHVPLEAVETLFQDEPDVAGIAAPGMPDYSPGMGPRGDEPLTIYAFGGADEVYTYTDV